MPFIPHTREDVTAMLAVIGADRVDDLFDEIPAGLMNPALPPMPPALGEHALMRLARERAAACPAVSSFLGAGAYEHHIPAAVWQLVTRGEFYTAYTPYQAEASQGTLQILYEWQTEIAGLCGMDVSNASLYDGATALAEAVLMAVRAGKGPCRRVLVPANLPPHYRAALHTAVVPQRIVLESVPYDAASGRIDGEALARALREPCCAVVINQPNFFGQIEDAEPLTDAIHAAGALVIAVANPLALTLLQPPGAWGARGADIVCGEAQPLGIPLSGGGPYLGYMTCKAPLMRQMPGRIAGRTVDADGRPGFTLTLQAREQHIRRSKATSNICTNQGLLVTAATLHMALLGATGLEAVATACHANLVALRDRLERIAGVTRVFAGAQFHEAVIRLPRPVAPVLQRLLRRGFLGGFDLSVDYPELGNALLICATETKTASDLETFAQALDEALHD